MKIFFLSYKKNGYAISDPLLNVADIKTLRAELDEEFNDYREGVILGIEKIKDQDLLKKVIKIFASTKSIKQLKTLKIQLTKIYFFFQKFQIHKIIMLT